jgi:glycosyltransferase involved in cell wall biosynthesis
VPAVPEPSLTIVVPVLNAREHVGRTVEAAIAAVERAPTLSAEIVVVDDGSTDGSAQAAEEACAGRLPFRVVSQPNRGRFEARRSGLEAARGDWVLLLDSRVVVGEGALAYAAERVAQGESVWTSHVEVAAGGNPYGTFWRLLAELAWEDYFSRPRPVSFGAEDFDRYPKGTTCFLAPRGLLVEAVDAFRSRYDDLRHANDDTPLLRWIAEREPIHISPGFSCVYAPREELASFLRHSFHRGLVFLDGHGRPESRFFPAVVAFYPASALVAAASLRRPALGLVALAGVGAAAGALGLERRRTPFEVATLAAVTPVYAVAHGAGMWRGLGLLLAERLRRRG